MTDWKTYEPPKSENEKIAKRLIELNVYDDSDYADLKDTGIYFLQDWLIEALENELSDMKAKWYNAYSENIKLRKKLNSSEVKNERE